MGSYVFFDQQGTEESVAGFLDLRQKPTPPPEGFQEAIEELEKSVEAPNPALEKLAETPEALKDKPMKGLEELSEGYEASIAAEPPADAPVAPADTAIFQQALLRWLA